MSNLTKKLSKSLLFCSSVFLASTLFSIETFADNADIRAIETSLKDDGFFLFRSSKPLSVTEKMQEIHLPGASVAVIKDGKLAWAKGWGIANTETGIGVDEHTLFQAGSISKPIGALAALKLVEEGKIDLDTDVNQYLKGWKVEGKKLKKENPVTLRHLLTHTGGLTVHGFPGYAEKDIPSTVEVLNGVGNTARVEVSEKPGSEWSYSGGGYTVMQKIVEDVTGLSFAEYTDANILKPLGMTSSTYQHDLPEHLEARASAAFDRKGNMFKQVYNNYPEKPAAGLWTTPSDIAQYVIHMQKIIKGDGSGLLKKETVEAMFQKHKNNWGLGPEMSDKSGKQVFGHGGKNLGFTNNFRAFVNQGDGFVVMTNGDSGGKLIKALMMSISDHYKFGLVE